MKIAMVSEHASPLATLGGVDAGGQNVHVAALAKELAKLGASVVVYTRRDDPQLPRRTELAPGVMVEHIDAGPAEQVRKDDLLQYMDTFAEELARRWREDPPEIVHAHFWMSGYAALQAARGLGCPVVQTFHALGVVKRRYQGEKDTSPPERIPIEREVLARSDHVVATCTDEVFELLRLGAQHSRLTVIPCGVDLSLFTPEGPRARRRPGMRRLVSLGRLVERKGIGNVISALPALPDAELVIAGGPARAELERDQEARRLRRLAEGLGVAERIELRGRLDREAVPSLLRSADAVVSVPWYEPFGIVPVEAMACGVPVVASAIGGMVDTIVDDVTGVHVPPRDPERLAEVLSGLLSDPARLAAYGQAGVLRARTRYGWGRVGAATLDLYGRLLARRASGRRRQRSGPSDGAVQAGREHCEALIGGLRSLESQLEQIEAWGRSLARLLSDGGRLLAVGNGGSAAEAQHLTAELVGRYESERQPLSAICLHGDTSSLTAISNDYGAEEAFARQVRAHGRAGDVLIALSTSGRSGNVIKAVEAAKEAGMRTWALTGGAPSPLADACEQTIRLASASAATTQELHLVALHVLCGAVDREISRDGQESAGRRQAPSRKEIAR